MSIAVFGAAATAQSVRLSGTKPINIVDPKVGLNWYWDSKEIERRGTVAPIDNGQPIFLPKPPAGGTPIADPSDSREQGLPKSDWKIYLLPRRANIDVPVYMMRTRPNNGAPSGNTLVFSPPKPDIVSPID